MVRGQVNEVAKPYMCVCLEYLYCGREHNIARSGCNPKELSSQFREKERLQNIWITSSTDCRFFRKERTKNACFPESAINI
jgi:hypothetical protein